MTCRHAAGDPNCSSYKPKPRRSKSSPDADRYEVVNVTRVGPHLVLRVQYPNCANCAYEGAKVMVFLNVTEAAVLRWKRIDPHFRGGTSTASEAPSPAARFPASKEGWQDALNFAQSKAGR